MSTNLDQAGISDRELVLIRIFDAPPEKVFRAWEPSQQPFMTVMPTFENLGGKARYTARVLHWTVADWERHEQMGFHEGWGQCADQLADLLRRI